MTDHVTTIRTFMNQVEASFDMSFLQANGFDAVLLDEGSFQWNYAGLAIPIRLQVPQEQAQRAIKCLEDFHSAETSSGDAA
jgi:hypothetical protein